MIKNTEFAMRCSAATVSNNNEDVKSRASTEQQTQQQLQRPKH